MSYWEVGSGREKWLNMWNLSGWKGKIQTKGGFWCIILRDSMCGVNFGRFDVSCYVERVYEFWYLFFKMHRKWA